jgi:hypothetical protein
MARYRPAFEGEPSAEDAGGGRPGVLVRYRVFGGPVAVDQRLTVFEDGAVQLDERHRSRDPTWLRLHGPELDRLRAALDELPARRWSVLARPGLIRAKNLFTLFRTVPTPSVAHFQLKRGGRAIVGGTAKDPDLAALVELLDSLRVHAVRARPR